MRLRQLTSVFFGLFDEYPLMKKYRNRRIAPTSQSRPKEGGKKEIIPSGFLIEDSANRTFLSPQYFNESVFANGDNVTCQPAPMKLSEDFCTVIPIKDVPRVSVSSQGYQWTICAVIPPSGPNSENTTTGFLYSGEKLNCTCLCPSHLFLPDWKFQVQVSESVYRVTNTYGHACFHSPLCLRTVSICASCLFNTGFTIKICTVYDSATPKLSEFARLYYNNVPDLGFATLDHLYRDMSIPPHALPLSAFPPVYNETQRDLYANSSITWPQISHLRSWLGNLSVISLEPKPSIISTSGKIQTEKESEKEKIVLGNLTVVDTFFEAFEATNDKPDGGSGFEIDVKGLGSVRPLGQLYNFSRIPVVWALVFNNSLSMNSGLMGAANADLNGKQIGVNYLCTNTTKEWQSVPKVLSITVGSTLAVFSACFTLLVAVARRLDDLNFKRTDHLETDQLTDSHTQAILKLEDGEVVRLHTTSVEQQN
ncbi:hypothetical protein MJO28_009843 [Puccinia striiformis f. sp. tritici]|uniref:Uncharacterized protein n=1 Tax=Puccinia striiformis f. sp. tritici TaxID=168172 RepID=A0ACC0E9V8_9BASI|nr:hypothetical protein MJO28_009843 [Puccinia striiformis f. sp. tritici]